jgi:hypothetical protein
MFLHQESSPYKQMHGRDKAGFTLRLGRRARVGYEGKPLIFAYDKRIER